LRPWSPRSSDLILNRAVQLEQEMSIHARL
jgi:hypothetical protein